MVRIFTELGEELIFIKKILKELLNRLFPPFLKPQLNP